MPSTSLKTPTENLIQLLREPSASQRLEDFIQAYNQELEVHENTEDRLEAASTLLALKSSDEVRLKSTLEQSNERVEPLEAKLDQSYIESDLVLDEKNALAEQLKQATSGASELQAANLNLEKTLTAETNDNKRLKLRVDELESSLKAKEKEIAELNSGMDPKRLKKQLAESKKKRLETLVAIKAVRKTRNEAYATANDLSLQLKKANGEITQMQLLILDQKKRLDYSTGAFIFKDGPHYLLRWEEASIFETVEKESYAVKTAMYFHESGRMALISIDPATDKPAICRAPVGGVRPNAALVRAANDYLRS